MEVTAEAKKRRPKWTANNEKLFVDVWDRIIGELGGVRKNSHIYEEMCEELASCGIITTPTDVRYKINNLSIKYRSIRNKIGMRGDAPSSWPLYQRVHKIIAGLPQNNIVIEESIMSASENSVKEEAQFAAEESNFSYTSAELRSSSPIERTPSTEPTARSSTRKEKQLDKLLVAYESFGNKFEEAVSSMKATTEKLLENDNKKLQILQEMNENNKNLTEGILKYFNRT